MSPNPNRAGTRRRWVSVTWVNVDDPIDELMPIFNKDYVAIVKDGERFLGLITRVDLLNYLRRKADQ